MAFAFKPWALDFAPNNAGDEAFPRVVDPNADKLSWTTQDWDPSLRFWTLPFDPHLNEWLKDQDPSQPSIMAAREFASQYGKWSGDPAARSWLDASHLHWKNGGGGLTALKIIEGEIAALFELMEDDRDRYLAEINTQADGLAGYFTSFLWLDERKPWTAELIRCGLAIGNIAYMYYKDFYKRVRPSTICPSLVPSFGPPRHPAFPSGHSFLGHFIALLLLEITEVARVHGEAGVQPSIDDVMSTTKVFKGPLLWLAERLGKNRERVGVHYPSDSAASRWLAAAIWGILTHKTTGAGTTGKVANTDWVTCPTFDHVLRMAQNEWVGR